MKTAIKLVAAALIAVLPVLSFAAPVSKESQKTTAPKQQATEITWDQLMPEPDQKVIDSFQNGKMGRTEVIAYLNKLGASPVQKMDNTYARLPGYLVPLNMDKDQKATELLLVPTMGACIHVPPPPPNQTIYIEYPEGIKVTEAGYTPYWVVGTLHAEKKESQYTDTLYVMNVEKIEEYQ